MPFPRETIRAYEHQEARLYALRQEHEDDDRTAHYLQEHYMRLEDVIAEFMIVGDPVIFAEAMTAVYKDAADALEALAEEEV